MNISITKIIKSDYLCMLSIVFPIAMLLLYLDAAYIGILHQFFSRGRITEPVNPLFFLLILVITLCIFVPIFIIRVKRVASVFKEGIETQGKIIYLHLFRDRGRIEYEYEIKGNKYRSGHAVHRSKFVNSLSVGQIVPIVVAENNPQKAFLKAMY